jgi:D-glycero-D-manno-heptose 1,7-bisphosphate phosphatase
MNKKFIFLDRDGVINRDSYNYIRSPDEYEFLPGSLDAIVKLTRAGYQIGVATNQSGIARGYYDVEMLTKIHEKLVNTVRIAGGDIAAIVYCPHHPNVGCTCRKPNPGMLYQLAKQLHCRLKGVFFIGDRFSDIQAALAAGVTPLLVRSQMTEPFLCSSSSPGCPVFDALHDAVNWLLNEQH